MALYQIKQASTAYPLMFFLVDSSDHVSGKTGLTPTVTISKAGAAFGSPAGAVSEVANGWYKVAGNATDSGTLGSLVLHATGSGADASDVVYEVVAFDPQDAVKLGLTRVVANVDQIEGTDATDALDARILAYGGAAGVNLTSAGITAAGVRTAVGLVSANLDTQLDALPTNAELATALAAADDAVLAAIAALNNLSQANVRTAVGLASANLDTQIGTLATAAKLLKYVQLLARKDSAIATDNATELTAINASGGSGAGSFDNTTDSEQALRDRGDAGAWAGAGADPTQIRDAVWGNDDGVRTLTQTGAQVADAIDGEDLTVHRGDTFSATLTGITIPADWTRVVFTAKRGLSDADSAAVVQIVVSEPTDVDDGLVVLEGDDPTAATDGEIEVAVGLTSLTITIKPRATKDLGIGSGWFYDVQADYGTDDDTTTVAAGGFAVDADVTRTVP